MLVFYTNLKQHLEQLEVLFCKSLYSPNKIPTLDFRLSKLNGFEDKSLLQG